MPQTAIGLLLALLLGGGACSKPVHEAKSEKARASKPAANSAVLEGIVKIAVGHALPSYRPEQMERKIFGKDDRAPLLASCTPPRTADRQPVGLTPEGLLSGVLIAPSHFSQQPQRARRVHDVVIEDCRLKPTLVVAVKGDTLRVKNSVHFPFMPNYGGGPVHTLIPGQTYDVPLDKPGVADLMCAFTAPCGRTDVVVMLHPLAAITDATGKFRIDQFPAGETIVLSAWHPLFQETKLEVRVEPGETKRVELVLTPAEQQPPPAAP